MHSRHLGLQDFRITLPGPIAGISSFCFFYTVQCFQTRKTQNEAETVKVSWSCVFIRMDVWELVWRRALPAEEFLDGILSRTEMINFVIPTSRSNIKAGKVQAKSRQVVASRREDSAFWHLCKAVGRKDATWPEKSCFCSGFLLCPWASSSVLSPDPVRIRGSNFQHYWPN